MVISTCCRDRVYSWSANDMGEYYMCYRCDRPCDTMALVDHHGVMNNDTGRKDEAKAITGQP
jgi:hypothetical protein